MSIKSAIILSTDNQTISVCEAYCKKAGLVMVAKSEFDDLILELQENDYEFIICDCSLSIEKCIQHVKIIRKMRPKIPLIIIGEEIDKTTGGKLYQEGINHLFEKPVESNYLQEVLSAISTSIK